MSKKSPGIRCADCGSYYDRRDGQCDCKTNQETKISILHTDKMKKAYSNSKQIVQAYQAFDYK